MKKLLKVFAVAVLTLIPFAMSSSASAATCSIGYTGPDSNNLCTSVTQYTCNVTNTNTVTITNDNNQVVASGTVSTSGNGQGGSSTSGSVTNNNGTTFSVTITNPAENTPGVCSATVVVPATETPVTPTPVQPTQATTATALPKTSGDFTTILVVIASSLGVVAVLGVGGVALYRYYKSL
jgi:hypothetical protein